MKRLSTMVACLVLICIGPAIADAGTPPGRTPAKPLIIGISSDPPYTMKNEQGQWTGLAVDLWYHIARDLQVDYAFREMGPDEIVAALQGGKIDLTVAALFITPALEGQIDLSTPFGSTRLAVATLMEGSGHPWWEAVRIFFSWGTLMVIILSLSTVFLMGCLFWLIERKGNPEHFGDSKLKGIGAGIYWVGATLASGVCLGINLKSVPGRVLGLIWMLICALALSTFIASLSSSLTTRSLAEKAFNTDKLRSLHLGSEAGTPPAHMLAELGGPFTLFREEDDVLKALLDKKIDGFLYDEITLHHYAENAYRGKIFINPTSLKGFMIAFGLPKDSPWRRPVNVAMLKILDEPVWEATLSRYGIDRNFEAKPITLGKDKRRRGGI